MNKKIILVSLLTLSLFTACNNGSGTTGGNQTNTNNNGGGSGTTSENYTLTDGTDGLVYELNEKKDGYIVSEYLSIESDIVIPELYDGEGGILPVREIGEAAFRYTTIDSLVLPKSLRIIHKEAFLNIEDGSLLTIINLPEGLEVIEEAAFEWCPTLKEVTIPKTVKSIGNSVFHLCKNLNKITVDENNPYYCTEKSVLFDKEKKSILCYPQGIKLTSYDMPSTVETIKMNAFYGNQNLERITLSKSLKTVEEHGLAALFGITSLNFTNTQIETLGDYALAENHSLTTIGLPTNKNIKFGKGCFYKNSSLVSFKYEGSLTEIPENFFDSCSHLANVTLSKTVTKIGAEAFYSCNSLTTITDISEVTEIGEYAFGACQKLSTFNLPSKLTKIANNAFNYCRLLGDLTFGSNLVSIGKSAFMGCEAMKKVDLSNTKITDIGDTAFMNCTSVESFTFPITLKSVGVQCFENCKVITSIDFNEGLESIGDMAFYDCRLLEKVFVPKTVTTIGTSAFLNKYKGEGDPDLYICFESNEHKTEFEKLNIASEKTHLEFGVTHEQFLQKSQPGA